jgi:hypothetical protein
LLSSWRAGIYCAVCRRNVSAIGRQTLQTPQCGMNAAQTSPFRLQ